ncbi:hypothetical protein ALC53_02069 [Atta colombica]|uniref:Uncharacterized protein n=1 Tax=Atta colombica TaxID=520822 RepID=A0A195BRV1_9HYME|nr:hypothetical protein ALC53_02069 [Atta colombica]
MLLPFTVSNVASRNIFTSRQAMMESSSRCTHMYLNTRIQMPIPHIFRTKIKEKTHSKGADYTKLIAIVSRVM